MLLKQRNKIFIIIIFAFLACGGFADAQDEVIRVDSTLVHVPTIVSDRDGRYVTNLKKEDFQIFEDGVEQEIALFETTEKPFTALLLLDVSGSMTNHMAHLANAADAFVSQMRDDDEIIVATFSSGRKINILLEPTKKKDFKYSKQKILLQTSNDLGYTTTFDAVERAIKYMKKIQGRRAIVLFSDGEQYGVDASAKSNLRDAEEQEAVIYTIRFGDYPTALPGYSEIVSKKDIRKIIAKVDGYMQGLADKTGGRSYQIDNVADLKKAFEVISQELGQQYNLGYYSNNKSEPGQKRQIKVRVKQPNLAVRARDSYVAKAKK
ncbi:MAG TPA: VWA domain-containing protein [Pyrinomonadaceae bacterium]|jgi:VWFA-related protein